MSLLVYALNLRMYGEDPHVGTWQGWDSRCEAFLQGLKLEPRESYTAPNENPTEKGKIMSEETTPENVTNIVNLVPETPKKVRLTKRTKIMCGVAVAAIAAGAVALFQSADENETLGEPTGAVDHDEITDEPTSET